MKLLKRWSAQKLVAVDYDRRELRLAVSQIRGDSARILAVERLAFPANAEASDPAVVGRLLTTALKKMGLSGCDAILAVPRSQAILKPLALPPNLQPHEIASMVRFQVAKELPFGAEEALIDFAPGGHWDAHSADSKRDASDALQPAEGPSTLLTTAAIRLPVLDAARSICQQAHLTLAHLALRPNACLAAVQRCVRMSPGEGILFVYVSTEEAEISLFRDGQVEFSRSVPLTNGEPPTESAATGGSAAGESHALRGPSKRVALDALFCLQSLQATAGGSSIDACLLAGGDEALLAELKRLLEIPCESFDPASTLGLGAGDYSAFTLALGLAAGGEAKLTFDFANPKRPMAAPDVNRQRALVAAAGVCAVLLGVVLARSSLLGRREADVKEMNRQVVELKETNGKLKKLSARVQAIDRWQTAEPEWLDQLANLSFTIPPAEEVYVSSLKTSAGKFTLDLRAKDDKSLTRFTHDLKAISGYEPEPRGTGPSSDRYGYNIRGTLEVDVSGPARSLIAASQPVGRPADDSLLKTPPAPAASPPARPAPAAVAAPSPTPPAQDRPATTRPRGRRAAP